MRVAGRLKEYRIGVRVASTAGARRSASTSAARAVVLDLAGHRVPLSAADVQHLQAETERHAGRSSVARDLSLLLGRAFANGDTLVLRRTEARTLAHIAAELGMTDLVARMAT